MLSLFPDSAITIELRLRAVLMIGDAYRTAQRKAKAASVRRSYWKHIEKRRARSREERRRNRDKWRAYQREYYASHKQQHADRERERRKRNAPRMLELHLQRSYGITLDEYQRMLTAQGGGCAICGKRKGGSKNQGVRLHVDHDHITGKPRGLLCGTCNRGIGQLGDDLKRVRAAVRYLQQRRSLPVEIAAPLFDLFEAQSVATRSLLGPKIEAITRRVLGRDVPITRAMLIEAERMRSALADRVM